MTTTARRRTANSKNRNLAVAKAQAATQAAAAKVRAVLQENAVRNQHANEVVDGMGRAFLAHYKSRKYPFPSFTAVGLGLRQTIRQERGANARAAYEAQKKAQCRQIILDHTNVGTLFSPYCFLLGSVEINGVQDRIVKVIRVNPRDDRFAGFADDHIVTRAGSCFRADALVLSDFDKIVYRIKG